MTLQSLLLQQQKELFVHIIADFSIYNYDAHTGQFALDAEGKIIGYDKGEAFTCFNASSPCHFPQGQTLEFNPKVFWPSSWERPANLQDIFRVSKNEASSSYRDFKVE